MLLMGFISAGCAKICPPRTGELQHPSPVLAAGDDWMVLAGEGCFRFLWVPELFWSSSTTKTFQLSRELAARRFNTLLSPKKQGEKTRF